MHRPHRYELVAKRTSNAPTARPRAEAHYHRARNLDPQMDFKLRRMEKIQKRWDVFESAGLRRCECCQCDDSHRFLRVGKTVAPSHISGAEYLQFPKHSV